VTTSEQEVRALFQERSAAMGAKDIERVMALYSADVVYFDLVPHCATRAPTRYVLGFSTGSRAGRGPSARRRMS
jgi:ketosteroid isomerase-like protein